MPTIVLESLSSYATFENVVSENLFGAGFEARGLTLESGSPVSTVISNLELPLLRYPGGSQTEAFFDPGDPNNATPLSIFTGSQTTFETIGGFIDYVNSQNIRAAIVIPTFRYFDRSEAENGFVSLESAEEIMTFVQDLILGRYGQVDVAAFEIGNEWFNSRMLFDEENNPNGWTVAEFGLLQGRIVEIVNDAIQELSLTQQPEIWVQTGQNGSRDIDQSGIHDNVEILAGLSSDALEAVDGVVDHFYQPTREDNPLDVIQGGLVPSSRIERLLQDGWNLEGDNALDIIATEWNVRAARNGDLSGDYANITGFERLPLFLGLFADMISAGVDAALAYSVQGIGSNGGAGVLSLFGEEELTPTGLLFELMSSSLPGMSLVDFNGDGVLTSSEYIFQDANGIDAGLTYTFTDSQTIVMYFASCADTVLDFNVDGLSAFLNAGYTMSASVIHPTDGVDPLSASATAYIEYLSLDELAPGASDEILLGFSLQPYELVQLVLTRPDLGDVIGKPQTVEVDGSAGEIWLSGEIGSDVFVFSELDTTCTITDFDPEIDQVNLRELFLSAGLVEFSLNGESVSRSYCFADSAINSLQFELVQIGTGVVLYATINEIAESSNPLITFTDTLLADLSLSDFIL